MEEEEIDLREYLEVVRRRKWLVSLIVLISTLSAVVFSLVQSPVYEAKAIIIVEKGEVSALLEKEGITTNPISIQTQKELIKKRPTLERAANIMNMTEAGAVDLLGDALTISFVRNTNLIEIKAKASNPQDAKTRANAVARAFVEVSTEEQTKEAVQAIQSINRELEQLRREEDKAVYSRLVEITKTLELYQILGKITPAKIVEEATLPLAPINSSLRIYALLGLILGTMLGIMGAFLLEYFDVKLHSENELRRRFDLPILGQLPVFTENPIPNLKDNPNSPFAEKLQLLITNLSFTSPDHPLKSILITSPGMEDGKTSVALGLGEAFALREKHPLIIDCDMRLRGLSNLFNLNGDRGLSLFLVSPEKAEEHIYQANGCHILPSGKVPPNPGVLLISQKMKQLLNELQSQFDVLILDTPPLMGFTDTIALAPIVDGVLLVVRLEHTRWDALQEAIEALRQANVKILGVVVNGVRPRIRDYYYSYH